MFQKLQLREEGQGLVEYALILVLVAIVVIAVLLTLGPTVSNVYTSVICGLNGTTCKGPMVWGVDTYSGPAEVCEDLGASSGSAYVWTTEDPPVDGETSFYISAGSSKPPVDGLILVGTASCPG